jgi:hypothetical protein
MQKLHDAGADMNAQDANGQTALHIAVKTQQVNFLATLISFNVKVAIVDEKGQTTLQSPLIWVTSQCSICHRSEVPAQGHGRWQIPICTSRHSKWTKNASRHSFAQGRM